MSKFQLILLGIFGVFILIAVGVLSIYRGGSSASATVLLWGDIPSHDFQIFLNNSLLNQDRSLTIVYEEKSGESITAEFTEALARGTGPDLIILTDDNLWRERDKILLVPSRSISERDFKNTFVEGGEIFLTTEGVYALPLNIDPLVLYYNRDILTSAGQVRPIAYWDEIYQTALALSQRDAAGNLVRSAIALGEASNIPNFKSVISLLMLQAGTPIVGTVGGVARPVLTTNPGLPVVPAESALDFYTQFANPTRNYYSWNRSQIDAQTHFTSGDSAYYLGFASELRAIRAKNPTLNFAIAPVPQSRVSNQVLTFGRVRGLAISRGSRQPAQALEAAIKIISREASVALSSVTLLPSSRRDILADKPSDAGFSVFYDAALQTRTWLDPEPTQTRNIFREMIESVTSGRARVSEAVSRAQREMEPLMR